MPTRRRPLRNAIHGTDPEYKPLPGEAAYHGETVDIDSVDYRAWGRVGRLLYLGRKSLQISKREAARRAGISEALWRLLENGGRDIDGKWAVPNPRPDNLLAAALAVGQNVHVIFEEADIALPAHYTRHAHADQLTDKIARLPDRERDVVERLVDSLLQDPAPGDQQ